MRIRLLAFALASTLLAGGTAHAQQADPTMAPPPPPVGAPMRGGMGMAGMLMRADANHDGIVTRQEVIASSDVMLDRLDANRDGMVSPEEMRAARDAMRPGGATPTSDMAPPPPPAGAAMGRTLSRQQWHDRALLQFDRVDANHDGKVDQAEIAGYQQAVRERRQERRDGGTPPAPPPGQQ